MAEVLIKHRWNAEKYHTHSQIQRRAALDLLKKFKFQGFEKILDIGCGDGKITAAIAKKLPSGKILGIDMSNEMISFAKRTFPKKKYKNLSFLCESVQNIKFIDTFNVVFSSFALQWIDSLDDLFFKLFYLISDDGYIIFTMPLSISSALTEAVETVITFPKWSHYFKNFSPGWHFPNNNEISMLLKKNGFNIHYNKIIYEKFFFLNQNEFKNYIRPWFSYLSILPNYLKENFFFAIIEQYFKIQPLSNSGEVIFQFPRLDVIACKSVL